MSAAWATVAILAVTGFAIRAAGPVAMGGRRLPARLTGVVDLMAPALLTALIVVGTLSNGNEIELSENIAGAAAATAVLLRRRDALLSAMVAAVLVTALLRAVV